MASDKTRTQLKAYFETGDKPTQGQFTDLIESNVNITDDSTINGKLTLADRLTRLTPETVFKWNYINCAPPITTQFGNSDDGVLADGDKFSMIFPGKNGEMYTATGVSVGAFAATGTAPMMDGTIPAIDTATTHAGLNLAMDGETTTNVGLQLILGGSPQGGGHHSFTVGTHSGHIDATFQANDWTDFDCVVVGFRKEEEFQTAFNTQITAAGAGDLVYTDVVAFGIQGDTNIEIQTDLNNSGTSTSTDCGASVPVDDQNCRLKVLVSSTGVVTYQIVVNQVAGAGTLAAPASTAAFTFDDGDVIVPFIAILKNATATDEIFLKDVEVSRTPGTSYQN